jgi:hypothetical protein
MSDGTHRRATQAFYRGGTLTSADGRSVDGADAVSVGRPFDGAADLDDREVSSLHCALLRRRTGVATEAPTAPLPGRRA